MRARPAVIGAGAGPGQTRCVASWNSFDADADTGGYVARSVADHGAPGGDERLLCVNPLSFSLARPAVRGPRSEEHTSELQSLMRTSYAVFCLKKKKKIKKTNKSEH